ncbi:hypothetical protein B0H14DRAFT_3433379 [Mycena olivaceomarginata]|nr:hypothetical protein B0H14DRAFT_3433379 [Mycena olivaceomarginata]
MAAAYSPSRAALPCRPHRRPRATPAPPPPSSSACFPHGMQYGQYKVGQAQARTHPPPGPTPPGSEYPPAAAADWAPPPYVKEADGEAAKYPPVRVSFLLFLPMDVDSRMCGPPPPGFDATYAPSPGPPPATHISVRPS